MIHPRIILLGDTAQASKWVGTGKELARQTYAAGIRNKAYKSDNVEIRVENYLPATEWVRGWSKVWITAGGVDDFLAVVWRPEGIMLTTPYGFPKRTLSELKIDPDTQREYLAGGELINPPFGTLVGTYGSLNQVIINKYTNNKYLDRAEYILGLPTKESLLLDDKITSPIIPFPEINRRLRASVETPVILEHPVGPQSFLQYWPLFYTPVTCDGDGSYWFNIYTDEEDPKFWIDEPGLNHWRNPYRSQERDPLSNHPLCYNPFIDETVWRTAKRLGYVDVQVKYRQFIVEGGSSYRLEEVIHEAESGQWYCHWPEELLYDNDAYEMVFYLTNQYRDEVGLPPMHREIRGFPCLARMGTAENQRAETLFHDNLAEFRQGYEEFERRMKNSASNIDRAGENLAVGFSAGLAISSGRTLATAWRNSPPHYENMIDPFWDTGSTSHDIFGGVIAKATDGEHGSFNPPIAGGFFGQVFSKRNYWVIAGPVNQRTLAGRVSFFSRTSPMGAVYYNYNPDLICYSGRLLTIKQITTNAYIYNTALMGAALYYKQSVLFVRVIYAWLVPDDTITSERIEIRSITHPIHASHCDEWVEEFAYTLPSSERYNLVGMCTFDHTGEDAVFSVIKRTVDFPNQYYPRDPDTSYDHLNPDLYVKVMEVIKFSSISGFYSGGTSNLPPINYSVSTETIDDVEYISQYLRSGSGVFDFYPYYQIFTGVDDEVIGSSLVYIKNTFNYYVNQTRESFAGSGDTEYKFYQSITLNTKQFTIADQHILNGAIIGGDCYFCMVLYLDPQYDDIVYARIDLSAGGAHGEHLYGTMRLFVNDTLVKDFPTPILLGNLELKYYSAYYADWHHPVIQGSWAAGSPPPSHWSNRATQVLSDSITRSIDAYDIPHPAFTYNEAALKLFCSNFPSSFYFVGRLITGEYSPTLSLRSALVDTCDTYYESGAYKSVYGININVPFLSTGFHSQENVYCQAAHYKDRLVVYIKFENLWGFSLSGDDQYIVYANFPIETEVGIGPLKDIVPFGVV